MTAGWLGFVVKWGVGRGAAAVRGLGERGRQTADPPQPRRCHHGSQQVSAGGCFPDEICAER